MTAGTETIAADPRFADLEQVQLTVTDGETYTSKKFQIRTGVLATGNEDVDAHLNAEWTNGSSGAPLPPACDPSS